MTAARFVVGLETVLSLVNLGCSGEVPKTQPTIAKSESSIIDRSDPAVVLIRSRTSVSEQCTGVLIAPTIVLTSPRCSVFSRADPYETYFGTNPYSYDPPGAVVPIVSRFLSPGSAYGSIGVVTLASPAPTAPVRIATQSSTASVG